MILTEPRAFGPRESSFGATLSLHLDPRDLYVAARELLNMNGKHQ